LLPQPKCLRHQRNRRQHRNANQLPRLLLGKNSSRSRSPCIGRLLGHCSTKKIHEQYAPLDRTAEQIVWIYPIDSVIQKLRR
jgi:hypothetical protein